MINYHKWFNLDFEIVYFLMFRSQSEKIIKCAVIGILNISLTTTNLQLLNLVIKRDFTHIDDIVLGTYLAWKNLRIKSMIGTNKVYVKKLQKYFSQKLK